MLPVVDRCWTCRPRYRRNRGCPHRPAQVTSGRPQPIRTGQRCIVIGLRCRVRETIAGSPDLIEQPRPNLSIRPWPKAADLGHGLLGRQRDTSRIRLRAVDPQQLVVIGYAALVPAEPRLIWVENLLQDRPRTLQIGRANHGFSIGPAPLQGNGLRHPAPAAQWTKGRVVRYFRKSAARGASSNTKTACRARLLFSFRLWHFAYESLNRHLA